MDADTHPDSPDAGWSDDASWFADAAWDAVPGITPDRLPLDGIDRVLVLAARADEAAAALGATLVALHDAGVPMVVATPDAGPAPVLDRLLPGVRRIALDATASGIRDLVGAGTLVLAPCTDDGDAARAGIARLAESAAGECGVTRLSWPLGWWQRYRPADQRATITSTALLLEPGPDAVGRKHAALAGAVDPGVPGDDLADAVQRQLGRPFEVLFGSWRPADAAPADRGEGFDAMYDDGDDPWGWEDSWYERRRRQLLMATLQHERLHHVLELGCATGLLTADLLGRADHVTALDVSGRALDVARRRRLENVTWVQGELPDALPEGRFDAVVVSEVAYFLTPGELLRLLRGIRRRLDADGEVLFVDWRHPSTGIPLDGELVHRLVRHVIGVRHATHHEDADLLLDAWSDAPTPAQREGLA